MPTPAAMAGSAFALPAGRAMLLAAAFVLAVLTTLAPTASASWKPAGTAGQSAAKARSMPTGATPTTSRTNRNVAVSWAKSTFAGTTVAVTGYTVKRYDTSGVVQTIGSACNVTITVLTCTETGVPAGSWRYAVTPRHQQWAGTEGAQSTAVTVPSPSFTLTSTTVAATPSTLSGSLAAFVAGQTVTFRLDNATTGTVLTSSITPTPVQASGAATVSVTVPAGTTAGSHTIYAIGSGGDVASRAITVGPAFVKNVGSATCGATALAVTVPAAGVAAGNTIVLRLALRGTAAGAVAATDTKGNAYAIDSDRLNGDQRSVILRAYATTALASGNTINVTFPSATASGVVAAELTRIAATGALDVSATNTGSSKAPTASVTTANGSDLLIGSVTLSATSSATQPSGWTALTAQSQTCSGVTIANLGGYRVVDTTGAYPYAPTLSATGAWTDTVVAYEAG